MTDNEIRKAVTEQLIGMLENNILHECGTEPFKGWLEDGDAFINAGMSEEDTERAMKFAEQIEEAVEIINQTLDVTYPRD